MPTPAEEGSPDARICVLGEAPSYMEIKLGRPLVGPSGDVFKELLNTAGLARTDCYILNVWPWQVTKDRLGNIYSPYNEKLWDNRKGFTEQGDLEALPTIQKVRSCNANCILAMGNPAFDVLASGHRPIGKWRGSPLFSKRVGKKYIPTFHPAATLHGVYVWRYLILWDMGKLLQELDTPELILPDRNLIVAPTWDEVVEYFQLCTRAKRVCTDLEVMNGHVSCFSLSYRKDEALTVPLWNEANEHYWEEEQEVKIWLMYARLMGDPDVMKINHNMIGFDAVFLLDKCNIYMEGPIGDTMIAQSILYPDFRMGLDMTASIHTRQPYWKDDGKIWKPNHNISWEQFQRYCGLDGACTLEVWEILQEELQSGGYQTTYDMTVGLKNCLAYMTIRGLKIDRVGLEKAKVAIEGKLAERFQELKEASDFEFNPMSPKQCAEYLYEHCKNEPYKNSQGGVSTDDKSLSRLVRKGVKGSKEAKIVQEIRALNKLKSTYLEVELDGDDRLRCSWNPRGTVFGRLSSSQTIAGTGMNLQNLHPEFKSFIVAG
jgi:uracil-DNA glycosylase family 4